MKSNLPRYSAVLFLVILIAGFRFIDTNLVVLNSDSHRLGLFAGEESLSGSERAWMDPPSGNDGPADRPILSLRDLSNAMVDVAEIANPTVVTVFTERTVRVRRSDPFSEFFGGNPFFRQFEDPRSREQQFRQAGQGSGVIVSSDGYILTNAHVIQNADTVNVRTINNRVFPARVVGADPNTDIAVLKIEGSGFQAITLGDSDVLRVGEWVMAIGSPLAENLAHTVTQGIVSAKGRSGVGLLDLEDFIQTDAAINPGNSGGALINLDGHLVGINTAIASRSGGFQGIGFAIPINMARGIMRSLIETGTVTRGYIGVMLQDIDQNIARAFELSSPEGVLISQVVEDAPAGKAGIREGDIVVETDGRKVANGAQFRAYVASKAPGDRVRVGLLRDGQRLNLDVVIGKMPDEQVLARAGSRGLMERTGFAVEEITSERMRELGIRSGVRGVIVDSVDEESSAYRNNLRRGDVIVGVNRRAIRNVQEFNQIVGAAERGQVVLLQVVRGVNSTFIAFEIQ